MTIMDSRFRKKYKSFIHLPISKVIIECKLWKSHPSNPGDTVVNHRHTHTHTHTESLPSGSLL